MMTAVVRASRRGARVPMGRTHWRGKVARTGNYDNKRDRPGRLTMIKRMHWGRQATTTGDSN